METRVDRVIQALRPEPHTRSEKDLKVIAMPDSDRAPGVAEEYFRRRRHRCYRTLRAKLERAGLAEVVYRECRARSGKAVGNQACLRLTELGIQKLRERKDGKLLAEDIRVNQRSKKRDVHPLLCGGIRTRLVEEVGVVEQVYQLLRRAGKEGMSVPEIEQYLDGGAKLTGLPGKRIRRIVDAIAKVEPITESQRFEGSAMYLRIALKSLASPGEPKDPRHTSTPGEEPNTGSRRRKVGVTSLGQQRQQIVLKLLEERRVILLEPLGREVAVIEDSGLQRVDPKVMRRLLNDLLSRDKIKLITAMKPAIKESKRNQTVTIVALPGIQETSEEVRNLVTSVVNRTLYGSSGSAVGISGRGKKGAKEQPCTRNRKRARHACEDAMVSHEDVDSRQREKDAAQEVNEVRLKECTVLDKNRSPIVGDEATSSERGDGSNREAESPVNLGLLQDDMESRNSSLKQNSIISRKKTGSTKAAPLVNDQSDRETLPPYTANDAVCPWFSKDQSQCNKGKGDEGEETALYVVSDVVGKKITRINKLRAIDYGLLKGKMARVRAFHKTIYHLTRQGQNSETIDQPVAHYTVDAARQAPVLGCFTMSDIVANMTVGEYAAAIGFYQNHGDIISSLKEEKITNVREKLEDEVQGQTSSRQILNLVQTLTRLGLVESGSNSQWALSGGGLIRDFGKGLPSGVVPHGIVFTNIKAVDTYWRELEQFARCRMSRKPMHVEPDGMEEDTKPSGNEGEQEIRFVSDVYFPMRWASGVIRLQKKDQLIYESMLQLLSGVQLELNLPNTLITTSFIDHPLKRFKVEELEEAFERYRDKIPSLRATQRSMPSHEKLLLYSRYRTKNPIPQWIRDRENNLRRQPITPEHLENEFVGDHSCILHLSSKGCVVEGLHFRAGITSLGKRPNFCTMLKTRDPIHKATKSRKKESRQSASTSKRKDDDIVSDKDMDKKQISSEHKDHAEVDATRMVHVCKAVIMSRATAYFFNNSQALEWKGISAMVNWYVRKLYRDELNNDPGMVVIMRVLIAAMVKFYDILMVRAVLDALALKLVIRGRLSGEMGLVESDEKSSKTGSPQCLENVISSWKELDLILSSLIVLQAHDLKYSANVNLSKESVDRFVSYESAQRLITKEFQLNGLVYGREELLPHMLEVMSFRFRRVADMHMRENVSHGMLVRCISEAEPALLKRSLCCTKWMPRSSTLVSQSLMNQNGAKQNKTDAERKNASGNSNCEKGVTGVDEIEHVQQPANDKEGCKQGSSCGSGKYRNELLDLVVQIVGREHSHLQDSVGSRRLLDKFCWSDIALARDRLLLRGALTYRAERDSGSGCFAAAKNGAGNEFLSMLRDEGEVSTKWMYELSKERAETKWENSKLRDAVCDNGEASVSSIATNLLTKKMFFMNEGICMMARMSDSGASKEAIQLSIGCVQNCWTWRVGKKRRIAVRSELKSEVRRQLLRSIKEGGYGGRLLRELLECIKPRNEEDRAAVVWGLHGLLQDRLVRRFVVEECDTRDEQFAAWQGVLYMSCNYCDELIVQQDGAPKSRNVLAWWRNTQGKCDTQLVSGIRECVVNCLTTMAAGNDTQLITAVAKRYSGAPRRAALDMAWALRVAGEARVECCVREGDALTGRWRVTAVAKELGMVDGLGVFGWRRAWRCAWSVVAAVRSSWAGTKEVEGILGQEGMTLVDVE
ncbi:unnamed protein product [Agarophyton chilense]